MRSAAEGRDALAALREDARDAGATLIGAGLHPDAAFGDVVHVPAPRYDAIRDAMRGLLERTPTAALHVHVGMPDADTAVDVCNRLRAYLPLLQALAAHSPYWHGRDSGFASARSMLFRGVPAGHRAADVRRLGPLRRLRRALGRGGRRPRLHVPVVGRAPEPAARHGRGAGDGRAEPARVGAPGWRRSCTRSRSPPPTGTRSRCSPAEAIAESSFRAGRDGLDGHRVVARPARPVRKVAADALELARAYDDEDALDEVERILRDGGGADRMRAAHAAGGLDEVLARLAAETYSSTQTTSPIDSQL